MTALLGSIGWGLLAFGSITHVWHHSRLQELLAKHLDHERTPAAVLTVVEVALTVAIPVAFLADHGALRWVALAGGLLAMGFVLWISRLLVTGSDLPCACSFSEAPTSRWSLARAVCVCFVVGFAFVGDQELSTTSQMVATLAVGSAGAAAIFVLPEALVWPDASRALMSRVDAHADS